MPLSVGVALAVVPNIGKTRASGATRWVGGRPIVQLSGRFKTDDQTWFALGHDSGTLGYFIRSGQETFVDDGGDGDDLELEANQLAIGLSPTIGHFHWPTSGRPLRRSVNWPPE